MDVARNALALVPLAQECVSLTRRPREEMIPRHRVDQAIEGLGAAHSFFINKSCDTLIPITSLRLILSLGLADGVEVVGCGRVVETIHGNGVDLEGGENERGDALGLVALGLDEVVDLVHVCGVEMIRFLSVIGPVEGNGTRFADATNSTSRGAWSTRALRRARRALGDIEDLRTLVRLCAQGR